KGLDDLWAALIPPLPLRGDRLAVVQNEWIGQLDVRRDLRLIEVRGAGRFGIAVGTTAKRMDVQQVHDSLVILFCGEMNNRRVSVDGMCVETLRRAEVAGFHATEIDD